MKAASSWDIRRDTILRVDLGYKEDPRLLASRRDILPAYHVSLPSRRARASANGIPVPFPPARWELLVAPSLGRSFPEILFEGEHLVS
jgi:hypothetical protein